MSLLPPNATAQEIAIEGAISRISDVPVPVRDTWNPDTCHVALLPWLAWAFSVDNWSADWSETQKRAAINSSITIHRKKGTPWAVKHALSHIGYPSAQLIEYHEYRREWDAAGGKVLDGAWQTSGTANLSTPSPSAIRHVGLNHWAEYAIRLDLGEGAWSREHQKLIRRTAAAYAPARCHLKGLLTSATLSFAANILIGRTQQRVRTRFDHCKRLTAHRWTTLDGCWLLDDDVAASRTDGAWRTDGQRALAGTIPAGAALDSGHADLSIKVRSRCAAPAAGGDRIRQPEPLVTKAMLDGGWCLTGRKTDGCWPLNGGWRLDYPTLQTARLRRLDGTRRLGRVPGMPGVWMTATAITRRGGVSIREAI